MNDFPQTALPLLSTDHAASALSSELAAPPHLRPHAGASELGQLTDDRLEAILRVDALADPVHDRVRDTLAAVSLAGPMGELHGGVRLAPCTPAIRLAAGAPAASLRAEDHARGRRWSSRRSLRHLLEFDSQLGLGRSS